MEHVLKLRKEAANSSTTIQRVIVAILLLGSAALSDASVTYRVYKNQENLVLCADSNAPHQTFEMARSHITCSGKCGLEEECVGFNFRSEVRVCELYLQPGPTKFDLQDDCSFYADVLAITTIIVSSSIPMTHQVGFLAIPSTISIAIAATTSNEEATVATTSIIPEAIPATSSNRVATVATNVLPTTMFSSIPNEVPTIIATTRMIPIAVPETTLNGDTTHVVQTLLKTTLPLTETTETTTTTTTTTVKMQTTVPSCVANNPNFLVNDCSFPFTYNGVLCVSCVTVSSTLQCIKQRRVWTACGTTCSAFVAQYSLVNLTIPTMNLNTPVNSIQGWIVIHNIVNDSLDFIRGWADYRNGFGTPTGNYWFGLEKVYQLTSTAPYRLRIELLSTANNLWYSAEYDTFLIDSETNKYAIHLTGYFGDAGDSIASYSGPIVDWRHNGMKFTTGDNDNQYVKNTCCRSYAGSWYSNCNAYHYWITGPIANMEWDTLVEVLGLPNYLLKAARMMMKPV